MGVITEGKKGIGETPNSNYFLDSPCTGLTYYYYGSNGYLGKGENGRYGSKVSNLNAWKMNETIKVTLDLINYKITWYRDGKKMGTLDVEKGYTYFPAICLNGNQKFKLSFD